MVTRIKQTGKKLANTTGEKATQRRRPYDTECLPLKQIHEKKRGSGGQREKGLNARICISNLYSQSALLGYKH